MFDLYLVVALLWMLTVYAFVFIFQYKRYQSEDGSISNSDFWENVVFFPILIGFVSGVLWVIALPLELLIVILAWILKVDIKEPRRTNFW